MGMNKDPERQTGRTTRMLDAAISTANAHNRKVLIVFGTERECKYWGPYIYNRSNLIDVVSVGRVISHVRGRTFLEVWFDHAAKETCGDPALCSEAYKVARSRVVTRSS